MQVDLSKDDIDLLLDALEYYRTDVNEFGIRHGETPTEIAEAEMDVKNTQSLISRLGLHSIMIINGGS